MSIKTYYELAKPGVIYSNALTATGGFFLATRGHLYPALFLAMIVGLSLVIGSASVCNNYQDREIDQKMARTKNRVSVQGLVSTRSMVAYGVLLLVFGLLILASLTNPLTASVALIGFLAYVPLYGFYKRRSVHGTLIGSISGAIPPVVGYCAVTWRLDLAALLLFAALVFWQMPHFYAIAMYRQEEYAAANIPVLPIKKGLPATKLQILIYILAFTLTCSLFTFFHYTGYSFLIVMLLLSLIWLRMSILGFSTTENPIWARKVFLFSLIIITAFSVMLSIAVILP
jgi:protoheme IX farnesyltransferase